MNHAKTLLSTLNQPGTCAQCGKATDPASYMPWCSDCASTASHARAEEDRRWADQHRFAEAARRRARIEATLAQVPAEHADARFDLPELAARVKRPGAIDEARRAIGRPLVLLTDGAGAGKSTLAACLFHDVVDRALAGDRTAIDRAWTAFWTSAPSLARARREHKLGAGEAPEVRRALEASLLVVDDLGLDREDRDGALAEVIYERRSTSAPTIVTTGCSYTELLHRYGDGVARRLTSAPSVVVRCAVTPKGDPAQLKLGAA